MTILTESVLIESKSARSTQMARISPERATEILNKIKSLYFSLWQGIGIASTKQVADFYEVPEANIRKAIERHRDEVMSDGLKVLRSKALKDGSDLMSLPPDTSVTTIHTPRSTLRLGMFLEGSEIAKAIRTSLLDAVEHTVPEQAEENERLRLQLALLQSQERLMAASQLLGSINPDLPVLILRPDVKVIERPVPVETTVLVDDRNRAIARFDGVGISFLAQRYGFGKGQRANNACRQWLASIGVSENQWVEEPTAHQARKLPRQILAMLDRQFASKQGSRQRLLGE
jgi:hypothetical protein